MPEPESTTRSPVKASLITASMVVLGLAWVLVNAGGDVAVVSTVGRGTSLLVGPHDRRQAGIDLGQLSPGGSGLGTVGELRLQECRVEVEDDRYPHGSIGLRVVGTHAVFTRLSVEPVEGP